VLQIYINVCLDDSDSVGDIQSVVILSKSHIDLLEAPWCDQGVDLFAFDIVQFLDGRLDLTLVGRQGHDETQSVIVFNQFHTGLRCQGVLDNGMLVQCVLFREAESLVLWFASMLQRLWLVKVHLCVDACAFFRYTLLKGLCYGCGLGGFAFGFLCFPYKRYHESKSCQKKMKLWNAILIN
jgi:hypothetical protein